MKIKEAAMESGLSAHTIRFYEKAGMLPKARRDSRGWRDYDADLVAWLQDLARLRSTGMPLKDVRRFAILVHTKNAQLPASAKERLTILERHAQRLQQRRQDIDDCAAFLKRKIGIYRKLKGARS